MEAMEALSQNQSASANADNPTPTNESNDASTEIASSETRSRPLVKNPRGTKRPFWDDFTLYKCPNTNEQRAKCKFCAANYMCDSSRAGSSNVSKHWRNCKANPKNQGQGTQSQLTLETCGDSSVRMKNWTFDAKHVRDAVVRYVIRDEQPFRSVDKKGFRDAFFAAQPLFTMPKHSTIRRDCLALYLKEREKLHELFNTSCVGVCLTTDCWTSVANDNYSVVTAHWIDENWVLQKRIINFCLTTNHSGEAIGRLITEVLRFWDLSSKLLTITVDNVGSNDVACNFVKEVAKKTGTITKGEYLQVRCLAHIINLIVQDGLAFGGEHILKARAMVKYVRASAGRKHAFKTLVTRHDIQYKGSVKNDTPNRWNSTYLMLESVLKYRNVFEFGGMDIPALREGSDLGPMTVEDWERCEYLRQFLKGFYDLTNRISGSLFITSNWLVFHIGVCSKLLRSLTTSDDPDLRRMGYQMKLKYDKYFGELKKFNLLMFVATLLDPFHKMRGVSTVLKGLFGESELESSVKTIKDFAYKLFDSYKTVITPQVNQSSQSRPPGEESDWMNDYDLRDDVGECDDSLRSEFDLYLADRLEPEKTDVLQWWSKNHQRYPILARMARHVLAIPISTVPSESAFSTGRRTISEYRSNLSPEMAQALICTQDWLRASDRKVHTAPQPPLDEEDSDEEDIPSEVIEGTFYAC